MKFIFFLLSATFLFCSFSNAKSSVVSVLNENISTTLKLSGDLTGEYSLGGPINSTVTAESDSPDSKCSVSVLFRKVKIKQKNSVEAWLSLICTFEEQARIQKQTFKLSRSFLDPDLESQKVEVKYLSKTIKSVTLEFRDLNLQKGK